MGFSGALKPQELITEEAALLINAAAPAMTATACLQLPAGEGVCTKHSPDQFGGVGGCISDTFNRKVATSRKMSATPREDILISVATGAVTNCVDADCADCSPAKSLLPSFPAELFFASTVHLLFQTEGELD